MFLQVFFKKSDTLGHVIDDLKTLCTIKHSNPKSVPIHEEGDEWYFSIDIELSIEQLKATLERSGYKGEVLNVIGVRETPNCSFICHLKETRTIAEYSISLLTYQDNKLTVLAHPLGSWGISCNSK
jgi:hypothetical protein